MIGSESKRFVGWIWRTDLEEMCQVVRYPRMRSTECDLVEPIPNNTYLLLTLPFASRGERALTLHML